MTPLGRRKSIEVFLSFAAADGKEAKDLWERLAAALDTSGSFQWHLWSFVNNLIAGDDFDSEIQEAVGRAELGVFALSPAFLNSPYIQKVELPSFVAPSTGKRLLPIMLKALPHDADLRGLQARQIFAFHDPYGSGQRPHARAAWAARLADEMHRVARRYGLGH